LTLRVYLTGNVALEAGDRLVTERELPGRQGRSLLAVLAWERDRAVTAEELAGILWGDAAPAAWPAALRSLVSKLRGSFATLTSDVRIDHGLGAYQLRLPSDAWVDVEAAASAVHDAEGAMRGGDRAGAVGAALVANAIARRQFLQGDDGEWVDLKRELLRRIRVRALEVRGAVALANGDPIGAATDAEAIIAIEPYRETAHVLLMWALAGAGNSAEAVAAYERLRTTLAAELGIGPAPATEAAFLEIVRATR
jgi:SARP family transcriptional regulator, regulator of embCAB operon